MMNINNIKDCNISQNNKIDSLISENLMMYKFNKIQKDYFQIKYPI